MREAFGSRPEVVYHLAALTSVLESVQRPWEVHTTNVDMTARLLEAARNGAVEGFVMASTNAVVGRADQLPITESTPLRPLTPYGATKAAAEMLCSAYASCYGMAVACVRLTNVFGPGMAHKDSFVPRLLRAAASGGGVEIYGDGSMRRDYIYVGDAVSAMTVAMRQRYSGPIVTGSGRSVSVSELVQAARQATGCEIPATLGEQRAGEMQAVVVDTSLARSLGFRAETNLEEGLRNAWKTFDTKALRPD